jgi:hypothetical protein
MAELGKDASRGDIQSFVRERFGHEMTLDHISNCKGELAKKAGGKKPPKKKKAKAPPATTTLAPATAPKPAAAKQAGNSETVLLDDVLALKAIIERMGPQRLRTLTEVLSR